MSILFNQRRLMIWSVLAILMISGCQFNLPAGVQPTPTVAVLPSPVVIERSVMAEGELVPISSAVLNFERSGVIAEVLASEGDRVQVGEVIARLDGAVHLEAALASAQFGVLQAQNTLDDLNRYAEFEQVQARLKLAQAERALEDAQEAIDDAQISKGDVDQIDYALAQYIMADVGYQEAKLYFEGIVDTTLEDDEMRAYRQAAYITAKEKRDQALTLLNYYKSVEGQLDLASIEGQYEVAKAEREIALIDVERLAEGPDPDELAIADARLKDAQSNLVKLQADLDKQELVAPFDGVIASSDLKAGEFAGPGLLPLVLVDDSNWRVETTDLTELNVSDIAVGMPVEVIFDALPDVTLTGKVARINTLGENRLGDITYKVDIDLDELEPRLRWFMTAFVTFDDLPNGQ